MSDLMRDAVISMPLELAMGDEWSRFQFHDRAQELLKQVHSLEAERDQWEVDCREEVIKRREAEAERDRLREALTSTRKRLQEANECGVITDTLWYSQYETLFDYIDSALEANP